MSLDYNFEDIKNFEDICYRPAIMENGEQSEDMVQVSPITESIVWATMSTGLHKITEKNLKDWYIRLNVLSGLFGPPMQRIIDGERVGVDISIQDLITHIGLRTNAETYTEAQFWMKCRKRAQDEYDRMFKRNVSDIHEEIKSEQSEDL